MEINTEIIKNIKDSLDNVTESQIKSALELLMEGSTIAFIARYRKEVTHGLDENTLRVIDESYLYGLSLNKRKEDIKRILSEKELLTEEIVEKLNNAKKLVEVEDIYAPFKEKKKTKATEAIKNGLESLAKEIMKFPSTFDISSLNKYISESVPTIEEALTGAKYIIAEQISDESNYRKWIRNYIHNYGIMVTKKKKDAIDENHTYEMYYEFSEKIMTIRPHRVLAISRAENEKVISAKIDFEDEQIIEYLEKNVIKYPSSPTSEYVKDAIKDSLKRLILPSVEREVRAELFEISEEQSIKSFKENLRNLLLIPPMKEKTVLGFDPAYRTGCKLAVVDKASNVQNISVIYPHEPQNEWDKSKETIKELIKKYNIDIIAIGNGTASRESEKLVSEVLKDIPECKYAIVSEAGASVYSASPLAISEFPDLTVEKRSAISIARRLQDPLNELIKIDSKSIGVGLYQHDVNQKKLKNELDFVVTTAVNNVGVNINTASPTILNYISGLNKSSINKLIKYRELNGTFNSRNEIKKLLNPDTYTQSIGFMRVPNSSEFFDSTSIHPETYNEVNKILEILGLTYNDIASDKLITAFDSITSQEFEKKYNISQYIFNDAKSILSNPTRDYREDFQTPILKSDIVKMENLTPGMKLEGTVRNVVDFGAFVDIGIKNDGLVHISEISDKFIKHPSDVLSVGDIVTVYVKEVLKDKNKVSLTMKEPK